MKTTLDLPDDVALSRLVSGAVRQVYCITGSTASPQISMKEGRVVVAKTDDMPPVDRGDLLQALED